MMNARKLNVLYLCPDPGIPVFGRKGCSTHVRETCNFLSRCGHEPYLIASDPGRDIEKDVPYGHTFFQPFQKKILGKDLRLFLNNWIIRKEILSVLEHFTPDIIYERHGLYFFYGERLARKLKVPRIMEINSPLTREQESRLRFTWLSQKFENHIFCNSDYTFVVSSVIKEHLMKLGVAEERIIVQPIAVDHEYFSPDIEPPPALREKCAGKLVIGYVGTLLHYHRINMLFSVAREIAQTYKSFLFLMIGGEPHKVEKYRECARTAGVEEFFLFTGSVSYKDLPSYIKPIDIGIIPNTAPWASPTKMFEYAAMKKPIIAPDYAPIRDFFPPEAFPFLFPPNNTAEFTRRLLTLAADENLRLKFGDLNRQRVVERYTWQHYIDRIEQIAAGALNFYD